MKIYTKRKYTPNNEHSNEFLKLVYNLQKYISENFSEFSEFGNYMKANAYLCLKRFIGTDKFITIGKDGDDYMVFEFDKVADGTLYAVKKKTKLAFTLKLMKDRNPRRNEL